MSSAKPIIMVVDDQPDLIDGVKLILEVEGYEVWTAANGQHALDKLESTFMRRNEQGGGKALPDLILADIMMPVMDGYTLFQRVKANQYLRDIPFIFLTAKVDDVDIRRGKELGVDDYLTKPAQPDDLLSSIRGKLKHSKSQTGPFSPTAGPMPSRGAAPSRPTSPVSQKQPPMSTPTPTTSAPPSGTIILVVAIVIIIIITIVVIYMMQTGAY